MGLKNNGLRISWNTVRDTCMQGQKLFIAPYCVADTHARNRFCLNYALSPFTLFFSDKQGG